MDLGYSVKLTVLPGLVTLTRDENIIHLNQPSIEQLRGFLVEEPEEQVVLNSGVRVTYGGSGYYMLQVPDNAIMLSRGQISTVVRKFQCQ